MPKGMACPQCNSIRTAVVDTRKVDRGIERRRRCKQCSYQFVTHEGLRSEWSRQRLIVWKRGGRRVVWDTEVLLRDLQPAFRKNEFVSMTELDEIVDRINVKAHQGERETITTDEIEKLVLAELSGDERYASAYLWYFAPIAVKTAPNAIIAMRDSLTVFEK